MNISKFLRANGLSFVALLATAMAHAGAAIALAAGVHGIFDRLAGNGAAAAAPLLHPALPAIAAIAVLFVTTVLQRRLSDGIGLAYAHAVRLRLFRHLLKSSPVGGGKRRASQLLPFVGDLTAVRQWVGDGIVRLVLGTIISTLLIIYVALQHPGLAATFAGTLVILSLAAWLLRGPLDKTTRIVRQSRGQLSTFVAGRLDAAASAEAMGRSRSETMKLARRSTKLYQASIRRAWLVGALRGLTQTSAPVLLVLVLIVGAQNVRGGTMSAGEVLGLMSLVSVMGQALHDMGRALELFVPGRVALQRIGRLMAQPPRAPYRRAKGRTDGVGLVIKNLLVPGLCEPVSLSALPGEVILVDGASGAGKSALLSALGRIFAPISGRILIDGMDIATLTPVQRQRVLGLAGSAAPLLPGSIGMNLGYRRPGAPHGELRALAERLGLLRQGLGLGRTLHDPRFDLSIGEYEALLVGRAIAGKPPLLLLDTVDTRLPPDILGEVTAAIAQYPGVVVMVARSPQLRATATRMWKFDEGKVRDVPQCASDNVAALRIPGITGQ